jgi:hypothetical protein
MMISQHPFLPFEFTQSLRKADSENKNPYIIPLSSLFYCDEYSGRKKVLSWKTTMCGLLVNLIDIFITFAIDQKSSS